MSKFFNRTRISSSIPQKLLQEGKFHLIPIYYLMLTSELANEAIKHSGSYRFADHIYENKPKGRFGIGYILDAALLMLPSSRSFRMRYVYGKEEMHRVISERSANSNDKTIDILAVPSGLGRELFEVAYEVVAMNIPAKKRLRLWGLDLDAEVVARTNIRAEQEYVQINFAQGDALDDSSYPHKYDMILSTGFTDFLDDAETEHFYGLLRGKLKPGGAMVTSGMLPHRLSAYLMENLAELTASYRTEANLRNLAERAGYVSIKTYKDPGGLQTMLIAKQ